MSNTAPHERLRDTRIALGLDLETAGRRSGIRVPLLAAMESGRWADLPHGLYGRSAIRGYARMLGLDAESILAECEPLLSPLEDPIAALARMRGLRAHETAAATAAPPPSTAAPVPVRRALAKALAVVVDACAIAITLAFLIAATSIWIEMPPSALRHAGGAFATMGMLFACAYYLVFAGIGGRTPGDWIACAAGDERALGPQRRTLASILRDARMITLFGRSVGALTRHPESVSPPRADGSVDGERLAF